MKLISSLSIATIKVECIRPLHPVGPSGVLRGNADPWECCGPISTNIWTMADNILDGSGSGSFFWGELYNYGCAGQGLFFDPHSTTLGKPVDEIDKALYKWKKCVQCALKHYNAKYEETFYVYDPESNSCGKI